MKIKLMLAILILVTMNLNVISSVSTLKIERHSKLLGDLVYTEIYSYESFIKWLNETGLLYINIIENPLEDGLSLIDREKAHSVLDRIFNDGKIAMFVGGIHLRMLKKYAGLEPIINESDIANLITAIIRGSNITLNKARCDNVLIKFIVYTIYTSSSNEATAPMCKWDIGDLELYAKYILESPNLNVNERIISIIKYLYILRIAAGSGSIDRRLLSSIIEEISIKYSLVTALFMNTFIHGYNLKITDHKPVDRVFETVTPTTFSTIINTVNSDHTDLAELLAKALLIIKKLKEEGINIENLDIFSLIDTLMSINIKEYSIIIENVDSIIDATSKNATYESHIQVHDTSYIQSNEIYIDNQVYYTETFWYNYASDAMLTQYGEFGEPLINIDKVLNINEPSIISSQSLTELLKKDFIKEVIEYSNKPSLEILNTKIIYTSPIVARQSLSNITVLSRELHTLLFIIVLIVIGLVLSTILINVKIKSFFGQLIRIPRDSSRSKVMNIKSDSIKVRIFAEFWNTMCRFAKEFNLKIEDSYTHREIKQKLIGVIGVNRIRVLLERITYLYEVLRYGNIENDELLEELAKNLSTIENFPLIAEDQSDRN
ncbi:MAG: hypothetical protein QXK24_01370 [Ignisphaera sp.]